MESALFGYFCLPYTSASVDYFRNCNFEIFSWFDLFVFPRYMDDFRAVVVDYSTLYYDRNGYPEKRPVWHNLFHCRVIVNYFFLRFYIFLGFDQKCFLSSFRPKTEKVAFLASFFGAFCSCCGMAVVLFEQINQVSICYWTHPKSRWTLGSGNPVQVPESISKGNRWLWGMHRGSDKQWEMQKLFFAIRVKNKHGQKWNRLRDILRRSS